MKDEYARPPKYRLPKTGNVPPREDPKLPSSLTRKPPKKRR